ncbi:hypothetical protein N0V93_002010 [Gnomoniopsis smithogilvyi]|uniref:Prolyl 4-hydroxylase alpha subunit domain-containing protein n=1 Tax=Gnomoniopsis smithogilvyi TaxID=1191159 RepID=A0A9W9D272_9PEZI|nr:hypothetical protein N0V93_002010 [Gnomoniopsis smithogilvyi]
MSIPAILSAAGVSGQKTISSPTGLPLHDHTVQCVLTRARKFMGTTMSNDRDDIGPPQLVRYTAGQQSDEQYGMDDELQGADDSRGTFEPSASLVVTLQDNCTGGETYFPYIGPKAPENSPGNVQDVSRRHWTDLDPTFRPHQDGGLAFRPLQGNALFLVNLHPNGSKDERLMHVSLPVGQGVKIDMSIWLGRFHQQK